MYNTIHSSPTDTHQTDRSTKAYNEFWELIMPDSHRYREMLNKDPKDIWSSLTDAARRKLEKMKNEDALLEQLLDINPEGELLREIKDIQDELHMMTKVYSQQQAVVKEFAAHLDQLGSKSTEVTQKTKDKVSHLAKEVARRRAEIHELTKAAERTADGVSEPNQYHLCVFVLTSG
jgi:Mg2+ and Co2+ transporter CorA